MSGLPSGRFEDVSTPDYDFKWDPYLEPYKHYIDNPFKGTSRVPGFPGFSPADMNEILRFANQASNIVRTTTLTVDSKRKSAGITQRSILGSRGRAGQHEVDVLDQELAEKDENGNRGCGCNTRKLSC